MESLLLELLKNDGDVAFGDMVSGHSGGGLGLVIVEVFPNLKQSYDPPRPLSVGLPPVWVHNMRAQPSPG